MLIASVFRFRARYVRARAGDTAMMINLRDVLSGVMFLAAFPAAGLAQSGDATGAGGQTVCFGAYALCSSAPCADDPLQSGKVVCDCEIPPDGLNAGNSTCESRGQQLTSTFPLWDITKTPTAGEGFGFLHPGRRL